MRTVTQLLLAGLVVLAAAAIATSCAIGGDEPWDGTGADTDVDGDNDTDIDVDGDTDTDVDGDADTDVGGDGGVDAGADAGADADAAHSARPPTMPYALGSMPRCR